MICRPALELDSGDEDSLRQNQGVVAEWFENADQRIAVHQLRQFLQTSSLANEEALHSVLLHHLGRTEHGSADRDKIDFLLVQFFSVRARSPLEDSGVTLEYVAEILEPVLGKVEVALLDWQEPLEALNQGANACSSLQELYSSGILEKGKKLKVSSGQEYFTPAGLVGCTRFNFLMRRVFFRLMHQDLNAILDGLRELEARGVQNLDGRRAEFSAEEPVGRLRMICQSWKVMFQAEYSSGQPLRLLADLRGVVDDAIAQNADSADEAPEAVASSATTTDEVGNDAAAQSVENSAEAGNSAQAEVENSAEEDAIAAVPLAKAAAAGAQDSDPGITSPSHTDELGNDDVCDA